MPFRGLGALRDRYDPRDAVYEAKLHAFIGAAPPQVDLRSLCAPVRDQGQQGSCTGFALAGLREFLENKAGTPNPMVVLSPAFIYYEERKMEGTVTDCQAGAMPRDGFKVLAKMGACPEVDDQYNAATCGGPTPGAVTKAKPFRIASYERITTLAGLKQTLAQGYGCLLGIQVYSSFESAGAQQTGHIPMPKATDSLLGGHALFCCGYKDDTKYAGGGYLIVQNSWGTGFGDKGFVYLPYGYIVPKLTSDIWTAHA